MDEAKEIKVNKFKNKTIFFVIGGLILIFLAGLLMILACIKFELNGEEKVEISYKEVYEEAGVKLSLFGKDLSKNVEIEGTVKSGEIGKYEIKYSYELGLGFIPFNKTRLVEVKDLEKPSIELKGDIETTICPKAEYVEDGYSAHDEIDGDLTDKVEAIEGESDIKYKVTDSSGNSQIITRKINKEDNTAPVITLTGGSTIYVNKDSIYEEPGYKASDACEGDLTKKVEVSGKVDTSKKQTFTITYKVKDSYGNESKVTRKVIVKESTNPSVPGVIYLTFDDGPSASGSTSKILDVLKNNNVKATFFVTGRGPDSLIKRAYEEGHTIALHTYTHVYEDIYSSINGYFNDLDKIKNRVKKITGEDVMITRFPGGSNNAVSNSNMMEKIRIEVINRGYSYFDWNVDASDAYKCAKSSVKDKKTCVYNNVVTTLSKKRANIVLMHDTKSYTAEALDSIIKYGKNNGYTFDVLTEKTKPVRFK